MDAEALLEKLVGRIGDEALSASGASAAAFFAAMITHVDSPKLPAKEKTEFEGHAKLFVHYFGEVIATTSSELREAAFKAIVSAMYVSAYYAGGPRALERVKRDINKDRVQPAQAARRRDDIQEIIDRHSRELWRRKPLFEGNRGGTATQIYDAVRVEIGTLPQVPKAWVFNGHNDPAAQKSEIERIRKRVPNS